MTVYIAGNKLLETTSKLKVQPKNHAQMDPNPQWQNPPLQEVVFEIRFPPVNDYALFLGEVKSLIKEKFSEPVTLPGSKLPPDFGGVVRHRFLSEDKFTLVQIGTDVASVNSVSYSGFDDFIEDILFVIERLKDAIKLHEKKRLGLRYINKFETVSSPFETLNIMPPFQSLEVDNTERIRINHIKKSAFPLLLSVNIEFPIGNQKDELLFDLDAYQLDFSVPNTADDFVGWSKTAHDLIWNNFDSLVSQEEKNRRQ
ncbi:MAG: TIGR04255 family protein [Cyanobacteria bacterium P01_C01_bin.120]